MKTIIGRAAALGLMALLASGAGAWALPGEKGTEKIEKHRIVIVGPDGKEKVIEGLVGPMVRRGYLGIGLTDLTPELRAHFGAPENAGVMVSNVESDSPAEKAGVQVGDIIARFDGKDIKSSWEIRSRVRDLEDGQQVPLEVWRDRNVQTLTTTIALRERPELDMGQVFLRGRDGDGSPTPLHWQGELEGLPERIALPLPRTGDGPPELRFQQRMRTPREQQLEQRLQELEKKILELEKQLKR